MRASDLFTLYRNRNRRAAENDRVIETHTRANDDGQRFISGPPTSIAIRPPPRRAG